MRGMLTVVGLELPSEIRVRITFRTRKSAVGELAYRMRPVVRQQCFEERKLEHAKSTQQNEERGFLQFFGLADWG